MSKNLKDYDLIDISKIIWSSKIPIIFITLICILISYIIFNFQKINEYWQAGVNIYVYEPNIRQSNFDSKLFKENLMDTLKEKNYVFVGNTIIISTRKINQFGEISIEDKEYLDKERERLLNDIDFFLDDFIIDIESEIAVIDNLIDNYYNKTNNELFDNLKLMNDLFKNLTQTEVNKVLDYEKLYITLLGQLTSSNNSTNDIFKKKLDLELLIDKFKNKLNKSRILSVSELVQVRQIRTGWKIYILLGFAIGLLLSVVYISINNIRNNKSNL